MFAMYRTEYVVVALSPILAAATCDEVVAVAAYANPLPSYGEVVVPDPPRAVIRRPNCSVPTSDVVLTAPIAAIVPEAEVSVPPWAVTV
jgi:hypothetical protein